MRRKRAERGLWNSVLWNSETATGTLGQSTLAENTYKIKFIKQLKLLKKKPTAAIN